MKLLLIRNHLRPRRLDLRRLRQIARDLLEVILKLPAFDLGIHLVSNRQIQALNERHLHHAGPTDVIAFDYSAPGAPPPLPPPAARHQAQPHRPPLHGEIFIGLEIAAEQSRRFHTNPSAEVTRCLIHGVLHLLGEDDLEPAGRRAMKQAEDRLLRILRRRRPLPEILPATARATRQRPRSRRKP